MDTQEKFELRPWQQVVLDFIEEHDELVNSEDLLSLSDYSRNDLTKIRIQLPRGAGQTTLAAYIADHYESAVLYRDMKHCEDIKRKYFLWRQYDGDTARKDFGAEFLSVYELNYVATYPNVPMSNREELRNAIKGKKVVVVDNASFILPGVEDFLLSNATGVVIFLG